MVRQKSYTEMEQVAILNAILANKELLEDPDANRFRRNDAWREKWDEIATTIDSYFGTSRGATKIRDLYRKWKGAAKKKYKSTQVTALTAQDFESRLTMPEKILRQIRPDIFPKIDYQTTSTEQGTDEASYSDKEENPQPLKKSKNGDEDSSNNSDVPEKKVLEDSKAPTEVAKVSYYFETTTETVEDLNPEIPAQANSEMESLVLVSDSEMETLVLSLQSMVDLESTIDRRAAEFENGSQREMKTVGDIALTQALEDDERSVKKKSKLGTNELTSDSENENAGPSLAADRVMTLEIQPVDLSRNEPMEENTVVTRKGKPGARGEMKKGKRSDSTIRSVEDSVGPTDRKEIDEKHMEIEVNVKISDEATTDENRANWNERSESPKKIIQTDKAAAPNSEGADETLPELPVSKVVGKRKKAPRAKNAKKRKTTEGASIRL